MLTNYLKVAVRHIQRYKGYAAINIMGLATGMACCLLIFLYVEYEWTYDHFHKHADDIYRLLMTQQSPSGAWVTDARTFAPLADPIRDGLPEVEEVVRLREGYEYVHVGEALNEERLIYADSSFFEVFSFALQSGNAATALQNPYGVVLSFEKAAHYFGAANPVGQTLRMRLDGTWTDVEVTGVLAPFPRNSSITPDFLLPLVRSGSLNTWSWATTALFMRLTPQADRAVVEEKLTLLTRVFLAGRDTRLGIQPLKDIHFDTAIADQLTPSSNPAYPFILLGIAGLVLVIACINFALLAIGQSVRRTREVGLRKMFGGQQHHIRWQFWGEAMLMSGLALLVAFGLVYLVLPSFNALADTQVAGATLGHMTWLLAALGFSLLVGTLAGSYPAVVLARFRPQAALSSRMKLGAQRGWTQVLVVCQFAIAIFLMVTTWVMLDQLAFLQTKDLGFTDDHIITITPSLGIQDVFSGQARPILERYQAAVSQRADVQASGLSTYRIGSGWAKWMVVLEDGTEYTPYVNGIDGSYFRMHGFELAAGRALSEEPGADTYAVLVNEAMVRELGWTDPIGKRLTIISTYTVVGVVKDFNFASLHGPVEPAILFSVDSPNRAVFGPRMLSLHLATDNMPQTLRDLEEQWSMMMPDQPFRYAFLDEVLQQHYASERRWSRVVGTGAVLAIVLSCLGLLGLTALTVAHRTKEIGIRKVVGASVGRITYVLSRDFIRLVLLANVVAWPAAYIAVQAWLQHFAYRTSLHLEHFLGAAGLAFGIALLTISVQTLRAARANPVKALRYE